MNVPSESFSPIASSPPETGSLPQAPSSIIPSHTRRKFLQALAVAFSSTALAGCGSDRQLMLQIATLEDSFPGSIWREYKAMSSLPLQAVPVANRNELFQRIQSTSPDGGANSDDSTDKTQQGWLSELRQAMFPSPPMMSISLLGSGWLDTAIAQELLLPLNASNFRKTLQDRLPEFWLQAAERQGQIWGLPWSWGVTAIAYDRKQVTEPISDWGDLWRPDLAHKVVLPDNPREVVGLILKSIGQSYNTPLSGLTANVENRLNALHKQVLIYSSNRYLPAMLLKDAAVVVGWSSDLYQLPKLDRRFEVVVPQSGTALWWDLWVMPRRLNTEVPMEELQTATLSWFDYLLSGDVPRRAAVASRLPNPIAISPEQLPDVLRGRHTFQEDILDRAELLDPLPESEARQYLSLWHSIRT